MNRTISIAVLAILASPAAAQEFSWQAMLGQPLPAVVDRISSVAECETKPYSVYVSNYRRGGVTTGSFWSPFEPDPAGSLALGDPYRIGVDFPSVQVATCIVEGEAGIKILSRDQGVFRVEITYGECRYVYRPGQLDEFRCSRELRQPAAYDAPILASIGDNLKTRTRVDATTDNAALNADLDCRREWSSYSSEEFTPECRVTGGVADGIWTAFGVVETMKPGFFGASVEGRYVTLAQYVDVAAQSQVSQALADAVEIRVAEVRARVEERQRIEDEAAAERERGTLEILTSVP